VLAAAETSDAAFTLDNRMVDAPVLARARRILS
jgi:citrate lyase beta subunit